MTKIPYILLDTTLMLASCSANSNAPTDSNMPESVTVEDLGVFVSATRTGVQILHSRID